MRLAAAAIALTIAATAGAEEEVLYKGGALPPNTHVETRRDDGLVRDAMVAFAGTYVMNTWVAEIGDAVCNGSCKDHSYDLLYVPFVGPAIAAAMPAVLQLNPAWSVILVADAAIQCSAGFVALVAYLLPMKRVVVQNTSWHVVPLPGGMGITATF
jgi:hypothetical protein